MSETESRQSL